MNDCHPRVEQMKSDYMDYLYDTSGRADRKHPMHGLYTGLWDEHKTECAEAARFAWWEYQEVDPAAFDR